MSRADELLPIGVRGEPEIYPGQELTAQQRRELVIEEAAQPARLGRGRSSLREAAPGRALAVRRR